MELISKAFLYGGDIPSKYTCDGDNINPPLVVTDVPEGAKSLVLIMDDPDVPQEVREDGMWDHWIVFNIPPTISEILEGREPEGTPGKGTAQNTSYYGPCPPDGEHRYFFKIYALDRMLGLPEKTDKLSLVKMMTGHVMDQAVLMGTYKRR